MYIFMLYKNPENRRLNTCYQVNIVWTGVTIYHGELL